MGLALPTDYQQRLTNTSQMRSDDVSMRETMARFYKYQQSGKLLTYPYVQPSSKKHKLQKFKTSLKRRWKRKHVCRITERDGGRVFIQVRTFVQ